MIKKYFNSVKLLFIKFSIFIILLIIFSCKNQNNESKQFRIIGNVSGDYSDSLFLYLEDQMISRTKIIDGQFIFEGNVEKPTISSINAMGVGITNRFFFLENEDIYIDLHIDKKEVQDYSLTMVVIDTILGTYSAEIQYQYENIINQLKKSQISKDSALIQTTQMIRNQRSHPLGGKILTEMVNDTMFEKDEIIGLFEELDIEHQNEAIINRLKSKLFRTTNFQIGDKFEHFSLSQKNGELLSTKRLINERGYTLIDFWATWCMPCKKQFPKLKEVYTNKDYKGKFEIIGVSLDTDKGKWEKFIIEEKLTWNNIIDTNAFEGEPAKKYNVYFIPTNFLVDKNSRIIGVNLEPDQLITKLDSLML